MCGSYILWFWIPFFLSSHFWNFPSVWRPDIVFYCLLQLIIISALSFLKINHLQHCKCFSSSNLEPFTLIRDGLHVMRKEEWDKAGNILTGRSETLHLNYAPKIWLNYSVSSCWCLCCLGCNSYNLWADFNNGSDKLCLNISYFLLIIRKSYCDQLRFTCIHYKCTDSWEDKSQPLNLEYWPCQKLQTCLFGN